MAVVEQTYIDRISQAVLFKAIRIYSLMEAPMGYRGSTDFDQSTVRPDFTIKELLYGLRFRGVPYDLTALVSDDDVIKAMELDPDEFPSADLPKVQTALSAACSWVEDYLNEGTNFAR